MEDFNSVHHREISRRQARQRHTRRNNQRKFERHNPGSMVDPNWDYNQGHFVNWDRQADNGRGAGEVPYGLPREEQDAIYTYRQDALDARLRTGYDTGLSGLGAVTPLEQGATMALNFIPGVGPILSGVASLVEGIFGGGDPTPEWKLEGMVLQLRQQLAQVHQQLGIPDSWHLEGAIGSGQNTTELKAAVTEALGHPGTGPTWRADLYQAIKNLQGELQAAAQQTNNQQIISQVLQTIGATTQGPPQQGSTIMQVTPPAGYAAPMGETGENSPAGGETADPAPAGEAPPAQTASEGQILSPTAIPWIMGGAGVILLAAAMR